MQEKHIFFSLILTKAELLALTPKDFNFERQELIINKSYQRLNGRDVITTPKTKKSNRTIKMPKFLCEEMREYIDMLYEIGEDERLFQITKSYLHHEMDRGAKIAGVKRIRIHDLRHSAISLLIEMGFSALAIAERVGHESIDITYRYAHLFPTKQTEMADKLDAERMEAIWMKPDSFGAAVKSFPRARYMSVIFLPSRTVGLRETAFFMK